MKNKARIFILLGIAVIAIFLCNSILSGSRDPLVAWIEISPKSITVTPGECIQLTVIGYTEDGELADEKQMEKLVLQWSYRTFDNAFTVDENGYLTAVAEGSGNVAVRSENGKLNSTPITVLVEESDT